MDLNNMQYYLGVEIHQGEEGICLSQTRCVNTLLKRFRMDECKKVTTPIEVGKKLSKLDESEAIDSTLFRSLVGGLL